MKTWRIEIVESLSYGLTVEAENEEEARQLACEKWAESDRPVLDFNGISTGASIERVVERLS